MNILQILPALDIGGVETGTVDLARYLVRHGHKAIVVSGGGRLVKELESCGVRHYTLPVGRKSLFTVFSMIGQLADIIRKEDIDIIHARSRVPGIIGYFAARNTNRVFITTAHGYYRKHSLSTVMGWGRFVIVASNIMAKYMASGFSVPYDRIRLIPRGVDLKRFVFRAPSGKERKSFVIGMVARITPLKGHADFIRAIAILRKQAPDIKVKIVGSAPKDKYREDLDILVKRLGLRGVIEFTGPQEDISSVMGGFDLLVSATITPEAFGRSIIEAQASGVPVVATAVGGVVDIVDDGVNGLLCAANNPRDMADKILALYRDPARRIELAIAGRRRVEAEFNLELMMERTIAVYEEALKKRSILVIKMTAVGDVVLSIPSLRAIRVRYPDAIIKVLVGVEGREVLDRCPYIDGVIVCDFKVRDAGWRGVWRVGRELRAHCFDMVIDLQNNRKSHALSFLSNAPQRYGYDNGKWSFFLNKRVKNDALYLDPASHQFRVLGMAGVKTSDTHLEYWVSPDAREKVSAFFAENWVKPSHQMVGINVRASARWDSKNWPASYIAELCDRLGREYNARVILTGAGLDSACAGRIVKLAKAKPIVAVGRTSIGELASLIERCAVYITPDSAPMHIAEAVGTPCIALFGPTDPRRHFVPSGKAVVITKSGACKAGPCYNPSCRKRVSCMRMITVDEVFNTVKPYLKVHDESNAHNDAF